MNLRKPWNIGCEGAWYYCYEDTAQHKRYGESQYECYIDAL
ncbi:MAG: hypothetical protein ACRKFN_05475 [Desulfitobacterium sp.]